MNVELICIGTELLLGEIVNTNAAYIAARLADHGINLFHSCVVGDNPRRLEEALTIAYGRSDVVITTGGLGPTKDDLSKEVIARYFDTELVFDQKAYDNMVKRLKANTNGGSITSNNDKQAFVPKGSEVYENAFGTAPGFYLKKGNKEIIVLPGPPKEMKPMFETYVVPYLETRSHLFFVKTELKTHGLKESAISELLERYMEQDNPTVATYAKAYGTNVRVLASAKCQQEAVELHDQTVTAIKDILKDAIYSIDGRALEQVVSDYFFISHKRLNIIDGGSHGVLLSVLGKTNYETYLSNYQLLCHARPVEEWKKLLTEDEIGVWIESSQKSDDGKYMVCIRYYDQYYEETEVVASYQDGEGFENRVTYQVLDHLRRMKL